MELAIQSASIIEPQKKCNSCGKEKSIFDFYVINHGRPGKIKKISDKKCKSCRSEVQKKSYEKNKDIYRNKHMKKLYGLTLDQVREMLKSQIGLCANIACGKEISIDRKHGDKAKAFVDHCHRTGKVRGILCISCNTALGLLEQTNKVLGLTEYLRTRG